MASLQSQIAALFEDVEPDVLELITKVLEIEKELLHLERPHGVMDRIELALDSVAQASMRNEVRS